MSEDDGGEEYDAGAKIQVQPWTLVLLERTAWRSKPVAEEIQHQESAGGVRG